MQRQFTRLRATRTTRAHERRRREFVSQAWQWVGLAAAGFATIVIFSAIGMGASL